MTTAVMQISQISCSRGRSIRQQWLDTVKARTQQGLLTSRADLLAVCQASQQHFENFLLNELETGRLQGAPGATPGHARYLWRKD